MWFLEYPQYKEKYPDKTFDDWQAYTRPFFYKEMVRTYEEGKAKGEFSEAELIEAEQMIKEYEEKMK